jgi:ubiquinone/menaquinone biosynthesis C-methylase UbiE
VVRLHLPRISYFIPAENILEIASGYGRWTQFLQTYATCLTLVDIAPRCIDACRSRFRSLQNLTYHVNDGRSLDMIEDESINFCLQL